MPLIDCDITLDLHWYENCVIVATNVAAQTTTFSITSIKLYVPVVTLSTQDNAKLLEKLKSGFKRTNFLIDASFLGVNRSFINWKWSTKNNLQTVLSCDCRNKKL